MTKDEIRARLERAMLPAWEIVTDSGPAAIKQLALGPALKMFTREVAALFAEQQAQIDALKADREHAEDVAGILADLEEPGLP